MTQTPQLPDELRGLASLAGREGLSLRPVLLRVLTDLFVSRSHHTPDELRQFEAIAEGLIPQCDDAVLATVADRLAGYPLAPAHVLELLVSFGGPGAAPILEKSSRLPRERLSEIAESGAAVLAASIAARMDLDPVLVRKLAGRREIEVSRALARNPSAQLDHANFERLVRRAKSDRPLAKALCARARDPIAISPLFLYASQMQREAILLAARRADLGLERPHAGPAHAQVRLAELLRAAPGNREFFIERLALSLGCSDQIARDIVNDPFGEPMALVLAMLQAGPEAADTILTALSHLPMRAERRKTLLQLVSDVPSATAERIVRTMTGPSADTMRRSHQPVTDSAASPVPSRPAQTSEPVPAPAPARKVIFLRRA